MGEKLKNKGKRLILSEFKATIIKQWDIGAKKENRSVEHNRIWKCLQTQLDQSNSVEKVSPLRPMALKQLSINSGRGRVKKILPFPHIKYKNVSLDIVWNV